jgi:hypothetical protein
MQIRQLISIKLCLDEEFKKFINYQNQNICDGFEIHSNLISNCLDKFKISYKPKTLYSLKNNILPINLDSIIHS